LSFVLISFCEGVDQVVIYSWLQISHPGRRPSRPISLGGKILASGSVHQLVNVKRNSDCSLGLSMIINMGN
jgi:hypothetical protein